jgi:hypothetical protein
MQLITPETIFYFSLVSVPIRALTILMLVKVILNPFSVHLRRITSKKVGNNFLVPSCS